MTVPAASHPQMFLAWSTRLLYWDQIHLQSRCRTPSPFRSRHRLWHDDVYLSTAYQMYIMKSKRTPWPLTGMDTKRQRPRALHWSIFHDDTVVKACVPEHQASILQSFRLGSRLLYRYCSEKCFGRLARDSLVAHPTLYPRDLCAPPAASSLDPKPAVRSSHLQ